MKKILAASFCALVVSFVAACGGAASSAAGTYELDKASVKEAMLAAVPPDQRADKEAMAMLEGMANSMESTFDLKADGTATMRMKMEMLGQKMDETTKGTWKLAGDQLSLTTKGKDGKDETHTVAYANGSFSIEETEGPMKMKMVFRRK